MTYQRLIYSLVLVCTLVAQHCQAAQRQSEPLWLDDLHTLSSERMAGRKAGTPAAKETAQYLQTRLQQLGYRTEVQAFTFKKGFFDKK